MALNILTAKETSPIDIDIIAELIAQNQSEKGEIPWCIGNKTDPWDHIEAAMGLNIGGYLSESRKAFEWLAKMQLEDGSWYTSYRDGVCEDKTKEANMSSYIAVGMLHYYLISKDLSFLKKMWETIKNAIDFTLSLQAPSGQIYWAIDPKGKVDKMSLLTGSSSIYMSIKCALKISHELGYKMPRWEIALNKLLDAISNKPYLFNMTKSRFSMDWFYPILSGAVTGPLAKKRIEKYWKKFIVKDLGVRCVSDQPWITIAETSELCLALCAMGNIKLSSIVFNWIQDKRFDDGSFWCGYTFPDNVIWPEEKITWTNAVVLMAADAIYNLTPASNIFNHNWWNDFLRKL